MEKVKIMKPVIAFLLSLAAPSLGQTSNKL